MGGYRKRMVPYLLSGNETLFYFISVCYNKKVRISRSSLEESEERD